MRYVSNKVVAEPFTNSIGQTINPGDDVVVVTTGRGHSVNVYTAKFAGVRRDKESNEFVGTSVYNIPDIKIVTVWTPDGIYEDKRYKGYNPETRKHEYESTGRRYNRVKQQCFRTSCLQLNRLFKIDTPLTDVKI
jgi:hypothetical protein